MSKTQMNPKMNILYVIWSLGLGGAERVVINLAKGLDRNKFNPIVCCLNDKGAFAGELEREGITVTALNKKGKFDISVIKKIITIIRQNNIEIVNTHLWGANFWGRIAARLAGVSVIIATEHNSDIWKTPFHILLDRLLSIYTDKIITVSNSVREFYLRRAGIDPKKLETIYNGIEIKNIRPLQGKSDMRQEFGIRSDEAVLAVIGRLVPQKGHRYFLLALKELLSSYKLKGLIIGAGPLETSLKEFSQRLGLNGNAIFTGMRHDVTDLLCAIDVLVMPSTREGLPIVALEAMAHGVPVVAANVGGIPEVITDGQTGMLVEPEDYLALKTVISRLLAEKLLLQQIVINAKEKIKMEFSISNMVDKTERLYEKLYMAKAI